MYLNEEWTQTSLGAAYKSVREASMNMVANLKTEDFIPQPAEFVSPPRWHLAHTTWFFEEFILSKYSPGYQRYHTAYAYLFNSYYNHVGTRTERARRGDLSRPTVDEVFTYRTAVDEAILALLDTGDISSELRDLLVLGMHHEQQHQELFWTDIKYTLSLNPLFPAIIARPLVEQTPQDKQRWLPFEGGLYEAGYSGDGFHFDNERPVHKVWLEPFEISSRLVTNADYLEFVEDDGYKRFGLWHDDGWSWVQENAVTSPMYWQRDESGGWYQYTLAGLQRLRPWDPLCHVNYYEAAAYANWRGLRLPTEFEWERAADSFTSGLRWQWTTSAYLPYPGYRARNDALGEYNGKFMVNQQVLRGASVVTPARHYRPTYRNFFHPELGWQFTGIRLAR